MFRNFKSRYLPLTAISLSIVFNSGFAKAPNPADFEDQSMTDQVNVISKVLHIVKWSPEVMKQASFHYCMLGADNQQDSYLKKIDFHKHKIEVIHLKEMKEADGLCHSLYVENPDMNDLGSMLSFFSKKPVLLMSNEIDFARRGGHVSLFKLDDDYAFTLNIPSIEKAGFEVDLSSFTKLIIEPMPEDL